MLPRFFRPALLVLGTLLLSSCNTAQLPLCPGAAVLADASIRPVLKPDTRAADPSAELYNVQMTGIETSCSLDRRAGQTDSTLKLSFRATRAPSGQAAHYTVPYFVAINQSERVINKRQFTAQINFAPGAASVTFEADLDNTVLKLENGHLPTDYQFLAGLDMSDVERIYLKAMGRYAP